MRRSHPRCIFRVKSCLPVVVPAVVIAVVVMIPVMVMAEAATRTIPVAGVEADSFMVMANPAGTGVGRASPITLVPNVVAAHGIPVTVNPGVLGSGANWNHIMPRRGRRPNLDSDRDLGSRIMSAKQEH